MNLSQLILLFAVFILLATSILLINRSLIESSDERTNAKNQIILLNNASNLFEEIKTKLFDEKVISMTYLSKDSLTPPTKFGPDDETYSDFDDIDDFNNYKRNITIPNGEIYMLKVSVHYLSENDFNLYSISPTYYKLVNVSCYNREQKNLLN